MKRGDLIRYLRENGCEFVREGSRHSWWWNSSHNKRSAVPRHNEVHNDLAKKICS
ncbi:MAG: type II toxin-antitoxin system HicA family toxin [Pseudomonadota bacterium]|nr:type II toxin-antitoxin system HicA family toxin [Pseudomonadota bacterium]